MDAQIHEFMNNDKFRGQISVVEIMNFHRFSVMQNVTSKQLMPTHIPNSTI